jgi:hypothetical protein
MTRDSSGAYGFWRPQMSAPSVVRHDGRRISSRMLSTQIDNIGTGTGPFGLWDILTDIPQCVACLARAGAFSALSQAPVQVLTVGWKRR